jgi:hypothetical protein
LGVLALLEKGTVGAMQRHEWRRTFWRVMVTAEIGAWPLVFLGDEIDKTLPGC